MLLLFGIPQFKERNWSAMSLNPIKGSSCVLEHET